MTVSGAYGGPPADGAYFWVGTQRMNSAPVPFVPAGIGVWKATLITQLVETSPAGQLNPNGMLKRVTVTYQSVSANYTVPVPAARALMIIKEDARAKYDGPTAVFTAPGKSTATIPLKATVRDIAATLDNAGDINAGDVRLARVSFINRATGAAIATVNVTLPNPNDKTTGVAEFNWVVDNGATKTKSYKVGFIVSNYYSRNSTMDDGTIVVTKK